MVIAPRYGLYGLLFRHLFVVMVFAPVGLLSIQSLERTNLMALESNRVPLSAGQTHAIRLLQQARPRIPSPLFLFTDPNKDPDDLSVLIEIKYLQEHGFLDLRCALATLGDRDVRTMRAKFTRSVLDALGLDNSPGIGVESLNPPLPKKSRTGTAPGYPPRQSVSENDAPWARPFSNYEPQEYTAEVVFRNEGKWADPKDIQVLNRKFLTRTSRGEVAVPLDPRGRPLNPLGRTGIQGRGLLGRWGRNQAGDPLLTRLHPETGRLQVLVIERKDSGQKALPGGMVDEGEDIAATVARELNEETGARLNFQGATVLFTGVVDDPRNTDNAWMETTVLHMHLTAAEQSTLTLQAGDDAKAVNWLNVEQGLLSNMYASHADYVRLALVELKKSPDPEVARQATDLLLH